MIEVRPEQPSKAQPPILVTELGIKAFLHPIIKVLDPVSIIALQSFLLSYFLFPCSTIIELRPVQLEKAYIPILVTDSGIVIEVRPEQPEKAELPILVTELGIVIEVRPEQPEKAELPILVTEFGIMIEVRPEQL